MRGRTLGLVGLAFGCAIVVSAASPISCPQAEGTFLASLEGSWTVNGSRRVAPGEFEETTGLSEFVLGLDGCAAIERSSEQAGDRSSSKIVVLTAKEDASFELARLDSDHGSFTISEGALEREILTLVWATDLGDRTLRTRAIYRSLSADRLQLEQHLSRAGGEPWQLTYRAEYTRIR